ncbi:hypothetical protein C8Q78DRAFT_1073251 [Trametes maxima]|nr:hypothetical protein C8Q78DRAFT_1073251 [Trametes maxima]
MYKRPARSGATTDKTVSPISDPYTPSPLESTFNNNPTVSNIIVINNSSSAISVFVSKYSNSNGDDSWFTISPGARDSWNRAGWELVAFKNANDTNRAGVYVPTNAVVTFHDFVHISVL